MFRPVWGKNSWSHMRESSREDAEKAEQAEGEAAQLPTNTVSSFLQGFFTMFQGSTRKWFRGP